MCTTYIITIIIIITIIDNDISSHRALNASLMGQLACAIQVYTHPYTRVCAGSSETVTARRGATCDGQVGLERGRRSVLCTHFEPLHAATSVANALSKHSDAAKALEGPSLSSAGYTRRPHCQKRRSRVDAEGQRTLVALCPVRRSDYNKRHTNGSARSS